MDLTEMYKTGKHDRTHDPKDLMLRSYLDEKVVEQKYAAAVEDELGEYDSSEGVADDQWMMLLNDKYGDCVPAGIMETQFVLSRLGGHHFDRSDQAAEWNYENMGGWDPSEPKATDRGCDMRVAAKVWQKTGILDSDRTPRHSGLFVFLEPGNVAQLWFALKEFKAVVVGYQLLESSMEQTYQAEHDGVHPVWSYEAGSKIVGGHCVPSFGRQRWEVEEREGGVLVAKSVSWGVPTGIEPDYIENQMDDGFIVVSSSILQEGQIEGVDHEKMLADAKALVAA